MVSKPLRLLITSFNFTTYLASNTLKQKIRAEGLVQHGKHRKTLQIVCTTVTTYPQGKQQPLSRCHHPKQHHLSLFFFYDSGSFFGLGRMGWRTMDGLVDGRVTTGLIPISFSIFSYVCLIQRGDVCHHDYNRADELKFGDNISVCT